MGAHIPGHTQTHLVHPALLCPTWASGWPAPGQWCISFTVTPILHPAGGPSQAHEWRLRRAEAVPSTLSSCGFSPSGCGGHRVPALQKGHTEAHLTPMPPLPHQHSPDAAGASTGSVLLATAPSLLRGLADSMDKGRPWPACPSSGRETGASQPAPWLPRLHRPGLQMALRSSSCCLSGLSGTPAKAVLGPGAGLFP